MLLLRMPLLCAALVLLPVAASAEAKTAPKDAVIYIMYPQDGATLKGAFLCRFGLRNMGVAPAGQDFPNTGHHHLLLDTAEPINPNEPIPHDKKHLHFGGGETEMLLDLPPGKHTLQLVLGDSNHYSFNPPLMSKRISITISPDSDEASKRPRRRSHHASHRPHVDRHPVEQPKPANAAPEACQYQGLWTWLCRDSASTAAKSPTQQ